MKATAHKKMIKKTAAILNLAAILVERIGVSSGNLCYMKHYLIKDYVYQDSYLYPKH